MPHSTRYRRLSLSALMFALGLAATGVLAGGHRGHGPDFSPERIMYLIEHLDVTGAQRDQVFAVVDEVQPELRRLMFAHHDTHQALRGILANGPLDEATVESFARRASEQANRLVRLTANMMGRISALLTPAQREQLKQMGAKHAHS